jgi:ACT domain-containing protein
MLQGAVLSSVFAIAGVPEPGPSNADVLAAISQSQESIMAVQQSLSEVQNSINLVINNLQVIQAGIDTIRQDISVRARE